MVAQTMNVLLRFNQPTIAECIDQLNLTQFPLPINCKVDVYKCIIGCLSCILQSRPSSSDVWNDLAMAFLGLFQHQSEEIKLLEKCRECLKNAIVSTTCKQKSLVFAGFDVHQIGTSTGSSASHEPSSKDQSHLMEAWCAHAMHAEKLNDHDAMDLYRHSIVLRPTALSIQKYCFLLMQSIHNKGSLDEGTMISFETIKDLFYTHDRNDHFLHSLALLSEHFWYLDEAKQYITAIQVKDMTGFKHNSNRIYIKTAGDTTEALAQCLKPFKNLYSASVAELHAHLMSCVSVANLFDAISNNSLELFSSVYKSTFYPLLVSAMITFGLSLNQELFSALENIRPLHKLIDVYPTGFSRANADVLLYQQQNEEEKVLVRHDHLSDNLYELLKQKSEGTDPANVPIEVTDIP
uniref:Uncharacterized protein n=1 Tax=Ditylenchus dipsaci TaxID=166011 RepID=A0A915ERQ5_9BILA